MYFLLLFQCLFFLHLSAQTIAEKKASLVDSGSDLSPETEKFLTQVNLELKASRADEKKLQERVYALYATGASQDEYLPLLQEIKELRAYIATLQTSWQEMVTSQNKQEGYALWYQPETTLEQLILDFGSDEYVYLLKPEIADIKISVDSNLPIPRASWPEMLNLILEQNGVGIRQLNPFLRELYMLKADRSSIKLMTNKREDLEVLSPDTRIAFLLTPEPSEVRRVWFFLDNFASPESTVVQLVGRDIVIVAKTAATRDLLRLYDFISTSRGDKEYKAITLNRVKAEEMAKVLKALFNQTDSSGKMPRMQETLVGKDGKLTRSLPQNLPAGVESNGLQVMTLGSGSQTLFLIGTKEEIKKAEEVIREVEGQMGGARDKVVYWYTLKHSDPEETADVLSKVYSLMVKTGAGYNGDGGDQDNNNSRGGNIDSSQKSIEQKNNH